MRNQTDVLSRVAPHRCLTSATHESCSHFRGEHLIEKRSTIHPGFTTTEFQAINKAPKREMSQCQIYKFAITFHSQFMSFGRAFLFYFKFKLQTFSVVGENLSTSFIIVLLYFLLLYFQIFWSSTWQIEITKVKTNDIHLFANPFLFKLHLICSVCVSR